MGKSDKPRARMSAFAFFVKACRAEIRKRHPEARVSVSVLSRACNERWRSTTVRERAMFEHLAQSDKQRYEREMGGPVPPRARPRKDPHAPKKPLTAFFLFASSYRPQLRVECPGLSVPEQAKKLGQKWSEQTPEERKPFELRAAVLKEKYDAEVTAYHLSRPRALKETYDAEVAAYQLSGAQAPADMAKKEEQETRHSEVSEKGQPVHHVELLQEHATEARCCVGSDGVGDAHKREMATHSVVVPGEEKQMMEAHHSREAKKEERKHGLRPEVCPSRVIVPEVLNLEDSDEMSDGCDDAVEVASQRKGVREAVGTPRKEEFGKEEEPEGGEDLEEELT